MASYINMAKLLMRHVLPVAAAWLLRDVSMHLQQRVHGRRRTICGAALTFVIVTQLPCHVASCFEYSYTEPHDRHALKPNRMYTCSQA